MAHNQNDIIEAAPTRNSLEFEKIRLDFEELIDDTDRHCNVKNGNGTAVLASTERIRSNRQNANLIPSTTRSFSSSTSKAYAITAVPVSNAMRGIYYLLKHNYMIQTTTASNINNAISAVLANGDPVQFTKIPSLTPYLTVLTYWNGRNETSCRTWATNSVETRNKTGCNDACLGFCAGNCYGTSYKVNTASTQSNWGTNHCSSSSCKKSCTGDCNGNCSDACGGSGCTYTCSGGTKSSGGQGGR